MVSVPPSYCLAGRTDMVFAEPSQNQNIFVDVTGSRSVHRVIGRNPDGATGDS